MINNKKYAHSFVTCTLSKKKTVAKNKAPILIFEAITSLKHVFQHDEPGLAAFYNIGFIKIYCLFGVKNIW